MNYEEAKKQLATMKQKDNFMVVKMGYDFQLVLPYKDGLAFLAALQNVEQFDKSYSETRIHEFARDKIEVHIMSALEYERYKIAGLLNITPEEAKLLQSPPATPTEEIV